LSAFLQQQLIAQNATAAINKIFFITLNSFKSFINDLENRCKFTIKIAYVQKKL